MTIIIWLFLLIPANNAWAIHPASSKDITDIQKQIDEAQKVIPEQIAALQHQIDRDPGKFTDVQVMEIDEHIAHLRDQKMAAYNKAINMTITAYGLKPRRMSGKIITPNKFEDLTAKFQVD